MNNVENLLVNEALLPCTRVVNGFRLVPCSVSVGSKRIIWCISPNHSYRNFWFSSLSSASDFARKFTNNHTDNFWFRRWSEIYSFDFAVSHLKVS